MLIREHPDWPRVLERLSKLAPDDGAQALLWDQMSRATAKLTGELPIPPNVANKRWDDKHVAGVAQGIKNVTLQNIEQMMSGLDEFIAQVAEIPEALAAIRAGDFTKALEIAEKHGLDNRRMAQLMGDALMAEDEEPGGAKGN